MINATENKMTTTSELTYTERSLIDRTKPMCARAVGKEFTIRTDKNVTVKGTIISAEFGRFHSTGSSVGVVFRVVMECGANKTHREFFVRKLPQ